MRVEFPYLDQASTWKHLEMMGTTAQSLPLSYFIMLIILCYSFIKFLGCLTPYQLWAAYK